LVLNRDELYRQIADGIRKRRENDDLSQEELASRAGVTRSQLANIERVRQRPPLEVLYRIAGALQVDVSDLLPSPSDVRRESLVEVDYKGAKVHVAPSGAKYLEDLASSKK